MLDYFHALGLCRTLKQAVLFYSANVQCYFNAVLLTGMTLHLCISEGEKRMETLGGPMLHRSPMVPSIYALLWGNGELLIQDFR